MWTKLLLRRCQPCESHWDHLSGALCCSWGRADRPSGSAAPATSQWDVSKTRRREQSRVTRVAPLYPGLVSMSCHFKFASRSGRETTASHNGQCGLVSMCHSPFQNPAGGQSEPQLDIFQQKFVPVTYGESPPKTDLSHD